MRAAIAVSGALVLLVAGLPAPAAPGAGAITLGIECHLPPVRAMEFSYSNPTCWNHGGIHTFFLGDDTTYLLRGVTGLAFSVEQEFSAPTEGLTYAVSPGPLNAGVYSPIVVEVSLDGAAWTLAGAGTYDYLEVEEALRCNQQQGLLNCALGGGLQRQDVRFDIAGEGQEFRFLRVRQPYSQATQGLSGFLDHTRLQVSVDPGTPVPPSSLAPGGRALGCARAMEAGISAEHPCWFGGLDRYDSPSYFHTWFLGDAVLRRVSFNGTAAPYRTDDFFSPTPGFRIPRLPGPLGNINAFRDPLLADPPGALAFAIGDTLRFGDDARLEADNFTGKAVQRVETNLTLQASVDGQAWTDLLRVYGPFGLPIGGAVDLPDVPVRFLRIVPEKHYRYDDFANSAPLHHPRAFLVDSDLHVEGLLAQ